jgi:hypothetical protein
MMLQRHSILTLFLSGLCLACSAQEPSKDYSILNGNWHLTGGWPDNARTHLVTLGMGVDGNIIYGVVAAHLVCSNGTGVGNVIAVRGEIASDGSFMLESPHDAGTVFLSIKGKLSITKADEWSGSMATIGKLDSGFNCTTPYVDFVASRLVPLNGTYIGSAKDNSSNSVSMKVELAQGKFTPRDEGEFVEPNLPHFDLNIPHALPLIGTVTLSSSSGIITVDSVRGYDSSVFGAHWSLMFALKDGSSLEVEGDRSDPSGAQLSVDLIYSLKGKDVQMFRGSLSRR